MLKTVDLRIEKEGWIIGIAEEYIIGENYCNGIVKYNRSYEGWSINI
jgi:hypothetical protein